MGILPMELTDRGRDAQGTGVSSAICTTKDDGRGMAQTNSLGRAVLLAYLEQFAGKNILNPSMTHYETKCHASLTAIRF